MNAEARLAEIITALEGVGLNCLVMGGHAVRYYGLDRNTNDFDLHLAPDGWDTLQERLSRVPLFSGAAPVEGPSWRPKAFRRFQIGTLASGREEWLEFWHENHLLPPYPELHARREQGLYGGRTLAFLSLADLIRSKETERESDWQDVGYLEEFQDARLFARVRAGEIDPIMALTLLRSRRGFESFFLHGYLSDPSIVSQALSSAGATITQAYLLPCAPDANVPPSPPIPMEIVVLNRLRGAEPGSGFHLALAEVVRRQYKLARQAADKANKSAIRAEQSQK